MLIPVNQNIDEYKDDFYKGLTLRQSVISLITVGVGALVYMTLTMVLGLPQSLSLYMTLPVVFPIAAYGFLKIHGMNIAEYMRKRGAVKERSTCSFIPQMLIADSEYTDSAGKDASSKDASAQGRGDPDKGNALQNTGKGKKVKTLYLETEESIRDLTDTEAIEGNRYLAESGKEEMQDK